MKMKLTKTAIQSIPAPAKGRLTIHDTATPGLCVRITENDARAFYVCRWMDGKMKFVKLGDAGAMTVEEAQRLARKVNSDIADHVDPNARKRAAREAATLGDMWETYRMAVSKGVRTMQGKMQGCGVDTLAPWEGKRLAEVTEDASANELYKLHLCR